MELAGKRALGIVYAIAFLNALSFSIVIPVLPVRVRELAGGDTASAAEWMMLLASAWGVTQFLFSPLLGSLADRVGRRPVLLLSALGLGLDCLLLALAPTLELLLVARLLGGATSASTPAARAFISDVVPAEQRTVAFGRLASMLGAGFIAGPAVGGLLSEGDLQLPILLAAALCLLNFAFGVFLLPETRPQPQLQASRKLGALRRAWASFRADRPAPTRRLLMISLLVSSSNMIWASVWVLFCTHRFGWGPTEMGVQMMAAGLLGVAVQAWLVAPVVTRFGEWMTLRMGLAVGAVTLIWAALAPSSAWFIASMPVAALGLVLAPSLAGLLSRTADAGHQAGVQAAAQSLHGLATIVGPPLYGTVFAWSLRNQHAFDLSPIAVLMSAACLLAALVLAIRASRVR